MSVCFLVCTTCKKVCHKSYTLGHCLMRMTISLSVTPALGMSLRKVTLFCSNWAPVTDLKRIETPHSLYCDFGGCKTFTTCWSGSTVQVWVQVQAPACHLAISPGKGLPSIRQWPYVSDFVARFCKNSTWFSHGHRFFDLWNMQKSVTLIIYLGPLPTLQNLPRNRR